MIIGISGKIGSGKDTVAEIIQYLIYCEEHKNDANFFYPVTIWLDERERDSFKTHPLKTEQNWEVKKFADKLKDIVCLLIGCTREQLEDREFKEKELEEEWWCYKFPNDQISSFMGKKDVPDFWSKYLIKLTPRKILQFLGTEAGREIIHPNIWVNALFADYHSSYIFTDSEVRKYLEEEEGYRYLDSESISEDAINEDFKWSKHFRKWSSDETKNLEDNWLITDMRFPNELQGVKDRDGITLRINRDTELRYPKLWNEFQNQNKFNEWDEWLKSKGLFENVYHDSEIMLDNQKEWDYVIENNGSLEDLISKVEKFLRKNNILNPL